MAAIVAGEIHTTSIIHGPGPNITLEAALVTVAVGFFWRSLFGIVAVGILSYLGLDFLLS